jgi:hypothetical protein
MCLPDESHTLNADLMDETWTNSVDTNGELVNGNGDLGK